MGFNRLHTIKERNKISLSMKGKKFSEEHKKKISQSLKGKQKSLIHKLHMRGTKGRHTPWDKGIKRMDIKGENHPNWKGGKYRLNICFDEWEKIRISCLKKFGWKCQLCGENANNVRLDVHHKIPYRISKSNDIDNLIVLCQSCHIKVEYQFWQRNEKGQFQGGYLYG